MNRIAADTRFQCTMKSTITQITVILFALLKVGLVNKQFICNTKRFL